MAGAEVAFETAVVLAEAALVGLVVSLGLAPAPVFPAADIPDPCAPAADIVVPAWPVADTPAPPSAADCLRLLELR